MERLIMKKNELTLLEHHHQVAVSILETAGLSKQLKLLLCGIATFFNVNKRNAHPSRAQLSKVTGYCTNHITALIAQAVKEGYITSKPQYRHVDGESAPRQISNLYEFTEKAFKTFGLYYSAAEMLLNRNLRKKKQSKKEPRESAQKQKAPRKSAIAEFEEKAVNYFNRQGYDYIPDT